MKVYTAYNHFQMKVKLYGSNITYNQSCILMMKVFLLFFFSYFCLCLFEFNQKLIQLSRVGVYEIS